MRIFLCVNDWDNQPKSLDAVGAKNRLYAFSNLWGIPFTRSSVMGILKGLQRVKGNAELVMIDSGVAVLNNKFFSTEAARNKGKFPFSQQEMDDLVDKYVTLLTFGVKAGVITTAVEMDADHFVGYDKVKEYRKRLVDTGATIIPVWRPTLGRDRFWELVETFHWIALSEGIAGISINSKHTVETMRKLVLDGTAKGGRFHFFAGLRRSMLFGSPLYSADSTTWSAYARWALTTRYDPKTQWMDWGYAGKLSGYAHQRQIGVEGIPFNPKSQQYADAVAAKSYVELQHRVTEFWEAKGVVFDD